MVTTNGDEEIFRCKAVYCSWTVTVIPLCLSLPIVLYTKRPGGVSPDEAAAEIIKTLNNKRKEVVIAPSLPKMAVFTRCFFPDVFFAVMAAGVKTSAASEKM